MIGKVIPLGLLAATLVAAGCNVQQKGSNGNEDVKIETPIGGMKVKTNAAAVDPGIPVYPGATMVKKDKDSGAADVNMNFGSFHLRVRAADYQTPDSSEKVMAFYRNELAHYGDVIECKNHRAVGSPSKTSQGLTCDQNDHYRISNVSSHGGVELKAGDKAHQHIVAVDARSNGTKFDLLALDLPNGEKESN